MSANTQQEGDGFQRVQRRRRGPESDKVFQLQQQIKNLQRRYNSARTDLLETQDTFIVRMELPVTSFKWELKEEQILLVTQQKFQEEFAGAKEIYRECRYGQNMRRVKLPGKVVHEPISDTYNNGIWVIEFAKKEIDSKPSPEAPTDQKVDQIDFEKLTLGDVSKSWADEF